MKIYSTKFKGLKIIKIKKFSDLRGSVIKVFNKNKKYSKFNCFESYISFSTKGAVRGLHGQLGKYSQEKIIYCLKCLNRRITFQTQYIQEKQCMSLRTLPI